MYDNLNLAFWLQKKKKIKEIIIKVDWFYLAIIR